MRGGAMPVSAARELALAVTRDYHSSPRLSEWGGHGVTPGQAGMGGWHWGRDRWHWGRRGWVGDTGAFWGLGHLVPQGLSWG